MMEIFNTKTVQILITTYWLDNKGIFYFYFCLPYALLLIAYIIWSNHFLWSEEEVVTAQVFDVFIALMCVEQLWIEGVQMKN
jgi:hypothetical protein